MSEDRPDPRLRELTYKLMGMAPDAPPFPEEVTAMKSPATKQRPPMLVWAAAAAAVVLLVGLPLFLFRGGDTTPDDVAPTIAVGSTSTVMPSTSQVPGMTILPVDPDLELGYAVYLLSDTLQTATGDPALVPVSRILLRGTEVTADELIALAISSLLGLPLEPGYSTAIPDGMNSGPNVTIADGVATVDLPATFEAGGGTMAMTTRLAQVVYTATQFPSVDAVVFSAEGEIVDVFSSEGLILDGPQRRADYYDILPLIFLDEPAIGSTVGSPVSIAGIANTFEATVLYEIVNAEGSILGSGFTTATCGTGCWGDFAADVAFSVSQETAGEIVVYEESARDGARINELRFPVTLLPGGSLPPTPAVPPATTTTLPGEAFDIGPQAGDVIGVVGVAHDDVLNVRGGPGASYEIVTTLGPLADDVVATGRHRLIPGAIWNEVTANGVTGWVNSRFVGYLGSVNDLTSFIVDQLGGIPEAETMLDLGLLVAGVFDSTEGGFRMAVSVAPSVGDLGEVTYDVVGLADDSLLGYRLHILGQPSESGEGFSLKSVEATSLCSRGVTSDGLCI